MKNITQDLKETKIEISLRTGLMHKNRAEEAQTQITFTGYYIGAMNYFVRLALDARKDADNEINSIIRTNDAVFFENLQFITQITEAFAEWLPDYADDIDDKTEQIQVTPAPKMPDIVPEPAEDLLQHSINIMANKISHVLSSDKVSSEFKCVLGDVIIDAGNESGVQLDNPAIAKIALPLILDRERFDYSKGIYHTISTMLDTVATDEIREELKQYEARFQPNQTEAEQPQILDLSEKSEDCQKLNKLAVQISEVLKNPLLPERLYNRLSSELIEITADTDAPEWILGNLKIMTEDENERKNTQD